MNLIKYLNNLTKNKMTRETSIEYILDLQERLRVLRAFDDAFKERACRPEKYWLRKIGIRKETTTKYKLFSKWMSDRRRDEEIEMPLYVILGVNADVQSMIKGLEKELDSALNIKTED